MAALLGNRDQTSLSLLTSSLGLDFAEASALALSLNFESENHA